MMVRKAEEKDIPTLAVLCDDFLAGQREMEPALLGEGHTGAEMIGEALGGEASAVLLAEENSVIAGFIGIEETTQEPSPYFQPHRYVKIIFLYVAEDFRSRGVGRALVEEAARMAKEGGAEYLSLHTFANNEAARALYRAEGFEDARVWMRRKL